MFRAYELEIEQSWHRADHITSFAFATPLVRNAVLLQTSVTMMRESVKDAARALNTASLGYSFGELQSPSNPDSADVIVEGYSTIGKYTNLCNPYSDPDNQAVACVRWRDPAKNPHDYPHLGKESLYFEYPPEPDHGSDYLWTNDPNMSRVVLNNVEYLYMPAYIMHEFGHTAGLDHNAAVNNVMSVDIRSHVLTISDDDKKAMKSIYNSHTAH